MFKKILATFLAFVILTASSWSFFAPAAQAQWYRQSYFEWISIVNDDSNPAELFGERYAAAQARWVVYGLIAMLVGDNEFFVCIFSLIQEGGVAVDECIAVLVPLVTDNNIQQETPDGLLAALNTRPLSSLDYFRQIADRWQLVPEAQAQQGFGFDTAATIIFPLWQVVRNTTYGLLIIVIIAMAFMIMFRVKLSPQTVITVQSALPKVAITLILITFSYAIAGLLIDLMYVVIGLIAAILEGGGIVNGSWGETFTSLTVGHSVFGLMTTYYLFFMAAFVLAMFSSFGLSGLITAFSLIIIIIVVLAVIIFILLFRIVWMLLKTFVTLLLTIVFGPVLILIGALGGPGFGAWLKSVASQLAVFPVTGFMFVLAFLFLRSSGGDLISLIPEDLWPFQINNVLGGGNDWVPPLMAGGSPGDLEIVWLGVSLATLALIPKAADMIKSMLSGRPFAYGTAIGEGLAFAGTAAGGLWGAGRGAVTREAGYRAAMAGAAMQAAGQERGGLLGTAQSAAGRYLFGFGEKTGTQVTRHRETGAAQYIARGGTAFEGKPVKGSGSTGTSTNNS